MALTYQTYLKVDELLRLQEPRSDGPEHDELLFIVIHQVYELWFKEVLHELDFLRERLDADDMPAVTPVLTRAVTSSIDCSTISSRLGAFSSCDRSRATNPVAT